MSPRTCGHSSPPYRNHKLRFLPQIIHAVPKRNRRQHPLTIRFPVLHRPRPPARSRLKFRRQSPTQNGGGRNHADLLPSPNSSLSTVKNGDGHETMAATPKTKDGAVARSGLPPRTKDGRVSRRALFSFSVFPPLSSSFIFLVLLLIFSVFSS